MMNELAEEEVKGDKSDNLYGNLADKEMSNEPDVGIATPEINKGKLSDLKGAQPET